MCHCYYYYSYSYIKNLGNYKVLPIKSEIIDRFWRSRCLNHHIDLSNMIGSSAGAATASIMPKNGTKIIIPLLSKKSSPVKRFQSLRCLNNHIDLPYMMWLLTSGATNFLVTKIGTKDLDTSYSVYRFLTNGQILMFKVSKQPYQYPPNNRITCKWRNFLPGGQNLN